MLTGLPSEMRRALHILQAVRLGKGFDAGRQGTEIYQEHIRGSRRLNPGARRLNFGPPKIASRRYCEYGVHDEKLAPLR